MRKALPLMVQGTHSDAGKSAIVTALCRIFAQDGYHTAPFKSQNMALNSYITLDGKEIGRAQGVQAEAAGVLATTDMNPILIKPTRDHESQIVVHGKPYQNMQAKAYRSDFFQQGLRLIEEAYTRLATDYERVVIEGAGSPAEINLNDRELVNMRVARMTGAPVILVGDIEKGGVFASLVGTLQLLDPEDRERVIGVVINKFRGDVSLLEPGLRWFEEYTGKPVLGVIPYIPNLNIDAEDSVVLQQYTAQVDTRKELDIAVIRYPMISNFTDVDPFFTEPDCHVRFIKHPKEVGNPDLIILPGSKNTLEDMQFLEQSGLANELKRLSSNTMIFGICGGYQMLGERIEDPDQVESPLKEITGLGLLPIRTVLTQEKKTVRSEGWLQWKNQQLKVEGYEIHMGVSHVEQQVTPLIGLENHTDGVQSEEGNLFGTYFHGIFHNDPFRILLLNELREKKGLAPILERPSYTQLREESFDLLAGHVRDHLQLDYIRRKMEEFNQQA
ncbi:cobyric acid synthase [Caldalkalibacillus mannanilyticus]|uniref:cobyric acid synthase n=1 Tax=Caldalkalibacillus mannanilyticus TaxID=1418 RepID=UPI000553C483|nr:cobyric acid synthase [Caldalkalibacillus mannanilyticus]